MCGNCTILDKNKNYIDCSSSAKTELNKCPKCYPTDHDYLDISNVRGFIENTSFYISGFVSRL